jgi:hypothetical protein
MQFFENQNEKAAPKITDILFGKSICYLNLGEDGNNRCPRPASFPQ